MTTMVREDFALDLSDIYVADPAGEALWEDGALTEWGHEVYTAGDCWLLAWAMAELLEDALNGRLIYTLGSSVDWTHVVVKVGADAYIDADGVRTADELQRAWGAPVRRVPPWAMETMGTYQGYLGEGADANYDATEVNATSVGEMLILEHLGDSYLPL